MDSQLVMSVLNDALEKHPHPEVFNTDQYTSEIHTQRLKKLGITISMDGNGRATDNICIEFYNHRRFHETQEYKIQGKYKIEPEKAKAS
jgi:putative transposase